MRREEFVITAEVDADGIASAQSVSAAGNLSLDGVLVSGGKWEIDHGQQVTITASGDASAVTFTVYGKDVDGKSVSASIAGPNATTTTISAYLSEVTAVSASASLSGTITVGPGPQCATPTYVVNYKSNPFQAALAVDVVSGTVTGTVQHTFDDVFLTSWYASTGTWYPHDDSDLVDFTADKNGNYAFPPVATRTILSSATNGAVVKYTVIVTS